MYVKYHALFSLPLAFYLYFQGKILCGVFAYAASIIIDFDHYLWYIIQKKDFSLKNAVKFFLSKHDPVPLIFHTLWFQIFWLILVFSLKYLNSGFYSLGLCIFIGMFYHLVLDFVYFLILYYELPGSKTLGKYKNNKQEIIADAKAKFLGVV